MSRGQRVKTGVVGLLERAQERLAKAPGARTQEAPEVASREVALPLDGGGSGPIEASPLYGVALLKAAMELKRRPDKDLQEILSGVLARMRIPESEFRRYLDQHGGALRNIAERKQY
jgi:hypothetical protein